MRQQARAMPPSAPATSPFPKSRSTRRVVPAPARRLALAQPSTPLSMSTQVAPLVARRLEPGLARRARRCRAMRLTRRRRRSCGRRLRRHRTRQYHRRRLHRTRPHHRLHRRTWPPHRRHRSASLPLRRRHDPPRRRAPRRLPPKSARRINQSAERGKRGHGYLRTLFMQAAQVIPLLPANLAEARLRGSGSLVALSGCSFGIPSIDACSP